MLGAARDQMLLVPGGDPGGIAADVLVRALSPSADAAGGAAHRAFAIPAIYFALYLANPRTSRAGCGGRCRSGPAAIIEAGRRGWLASGGGAAGHSGQGAR